MPWILYYMTKVVILQVVILLLPVALLNSDILSHLLPIREVGFDNITFFDLIRDFIIRTLYLCKPDLWIRT